MVGGVAFELVQRDGRAGSGVIIIAEQGHPIHGFGRRVFFVEWIDPIFCGGHWVPEQIELAGGVDMLGRKGADSVRVPFEDVVAWAPEILIVSPCGAHLDDAAEQAHAMLADDRWLSIPAVRSGNVFAVDGSSYFARPGPRVFDGIELLAHLFHPDRVAERLTGAQRVFR